MKKFLINNLKYFIALILVVIAGFLYAFDIKLLKNLPYIPLQDWGDTFVDFLDDNFEFVFNQISAIIDNLNEFINFLLGIVDFEMFGYVFEIPDILVFAVLISLVLVIAWWKIFSFVSISFLFISSLGYWEPMMETLGLVLTSTILALIIWIPLWILKFQFVWAERILDPVLDLMQTLPLFVYLIPAVMFFGIWDVPWVVATLIFSMPPAVRLTALGLKQISKDLLESWKAFGCSYWQLLYKVQIPLALPSIMMGVNQTIMLSLSMVVVASMIWASWLGEVVYSAISTLSVGEWIASGIAVVLLAMMLDRITRKAASKSE